MSSSPRVVQADVMFTWDGVPTRLQRGQVIDVSPGSPLERAIGAAMLSPLHNTAPQPAAQPQEAPAPRKPRATVKPGSDDKDGDS